MTPAISPPDRRTFLAQSAGTLGVATGLLEPQPARPADAKPPLFAYVGTFSAPLTDVLPTQVDLPPGNGKGIHIFRVNPETGALAAAGIHAMGTSPSHLAVSRDGQFLYSANETDRWNGTREGSVTAFRRNPLDGTLKPLGTARSGGAGPTYVSIHPAGKHLFVANYFGGSVAVLPIAQDGSLGEPTSVQVDMGKVGPTKAASAPPGSFAFSGHDRTHAHMIEADPAGTWVVHVDLGLDAIFFWKFDAGTGKLSPNEPHQVTLPAGDGPRHFAFHPQLPQFYSVQEEGSTVVRFDYDAARGRLTPRQTLSTLPPGYAGSNFCSEILVSRDGKFLYVGNRLHDSIGIFAIDARGELKYLGEEWTRGNYPRSFAFDPSGNYLYCCNQRADHVTTFRVEGAAMRFTGAYTPVGNPSCVAFAGG